MDRNTESASDKGKKSAIVRARPREVFFFKICNQNTNLDKRNISEKDATNRKEESTNKFSEQNY